MFERGFNPRWVDIVGPPRSHMTSMNLIENSLVTGFRAEPQLRPPARLYGAVYGGGKICSQTLRSADQYLVSADPDEIHSFGAGARLRGHWLYAGHLMSHFGHFIVESLPGLWPIAAEMKFDGVIFHPFVFGKSVEEWQVPYLSKLVGNLPIHVAEEDVEVEVLTAAQRVTGIDKFVLPPAVMAWDAVRGETSRGRRLYLSRSRIPRNERECRNDVDLDIEFERRGFEVLHPQEIGQSDQIKIFSSADLVCGLSGSALHNSVLTSSRTRIVEIGNRRTPDRPHPQQVLMDNAAGRPLGFVPFYVDGENRDITRTMTAFESLF